MYVLFLSATSTSQVATTSHRTHGHRNLCSAKRRQKCLLPRLYSVVPWLLWTIVVVGSFVIVGVLTSKGLTGSEEYDDIGAPCRCRGIAGGKDVEMDWMLLVLMTLLFKWVIYQPVILFVATIMHLSSVNRLAEGFVLQQGMIEEVELAASSWDKGSSKGSSNGTSDSSDDDVTMDRHGNDKFRSSPMGAKKTSIHLNIVENPLQTSFMSEKIRRRGSSRRGSKDGATDGAPLVDNPMRGGNSGRQVSTTETRSEIELDNGGLTPANVANAGAPMAGMNFYKKRAARDGGSSRRKGSTKGGASSTSAALKRGDYIAQFRTKVRHNSATKLIVGCMSIRCRSITAGLEGANFGVCYPVVLTTCPNSTFVFPRSPSCPILCVPTQSGESTRGKRNFLNKSKKKMFEQAPQQVLHKGSARKVGGADGTTATNGAGGDTALHERGAYKEGEGGSAFFEDRLPQASRTESSSSRLSL